MRNHIRAIIHSIRSILISSSFWRTTGASILFFIIVTSCTSSKNTGTTRWYHSFNTRYNVYFNGDMAFQEALRGLQDGYQENYSEMILMYPVSSLSKEKEQPGGPFDKSMEKAVKAIKTHSIKTKPERKSGKRNDPKYQEFMSRDEYNPFLHNAWMLFAKSQFYNGDFLQSASSFSYVSRHYISQPEIAIPAKIWQARSYSEMGWYYEADDILSKIDVAHLSKKDNNWFSSVYADYLIKQKQYKDAIPYLQTAIKAEKNGRQRSRMKYLLGQVYQDIGQDAIAYKTFGDVVGSNPPYKLEFSAKIRQTEVYPEGNNQKIIKMLQKMAKNVKNKDYQDQVYYALGNVYMNIPDTLKAIENYALGVKKSTANGLDKAFCQIRLGDIYFSQRNYVEAQPCYAEALPLLKKDDKNYPRISKRSEALDELVVHYEAVHLQDSLQVLSRMTKTEQLAVVTKIINDIIKKEEEEKKKAEKENFLAEQDAKKQEQQSFSPITPPSGVINTALPPSLVESFYFYNEQAVAIGKTSFQQKWGRRKLEDDWRRRNKTNPVLDEFADGTQQQQKPILQTDSVPVLPDSLAVEDEGTEKLAGTSSDLKDPQFYLQQIPVTEEDIAASNLIIEDGIFNMGLIYKDKLEDYNLSIESFNTLNSRFPDNENKLTSYYQLYLIYLRLDNKEMAELYKAKIKSEFPKSDYAIAMADPDYEYNIRMMDVMQDSIYQQTYQAYTNGNTSIIRKNYELVKNKYSQSKLMPKFMFLNALSYVQTHEPDTFKVRLKELIEKFPEADVTVLASEMIIRFQKGLTLSGGDGNLAKGMLFSIRFGGEGSDPSVADSSQIFSPEKNTAHMLMLIYPKGSINENVMLYTVAEYNFSNFMVSDFDLHFETFGEVGMLQISGFNSYDEVIQYWKMINQSVGYASKLGKDVVIVPISMENYSLLIKGKSLDEYTSFFTKTYGKDNAVLIEKWKTKQQEEIDKLAEEEKEAIADDQEAKAKAEADSAAQKEKAATPVVKVELDQDSVNVIQIQDSIVPSITDSISKVTKESTDSVKAITGDDLLDSADDAVSKASKTVNQVQDTYNEITSDPVRGIQNLFKRKKSNAIDDYAKQQEKEEKERQKQLKKEKEEEDKAKRESQEQQNKDRKALLKQQQQEEQAVLKEKKQKEEALAKDKKEEQRQKDADKERVKKERENARKLKKQEYDAEQKQKADDRKAKEKAYKEEQKLKAKTRQEAQKRKEAEREAKQKQRDEERKAKENTRKTSK